MTFATRISFSRCRRIASHRPPGSRSPALHHPRASRLALLSRASRAARLVRLPARSQTWVARPRLGLPPPGPSPADRPHAHAHAAATATRAIARRADLSHCLSIDRPTDGGRTDRPNPPTIAYGAADRSIGAMSCLVSLCFPVAARTGKGTSVPSRCYLERNGMQCNATSTQRNATQRNGMPCHAMERNPARRDAMQCDERDAVEHAGDPHHHHPTQCL